MTRGVFTVPTCFGGRVLLYKPPAASAEGCGAEQQPALPEVWTGAAISVVAAAPGVDVVIRRKFTVSHACGGGGDATDPCDEKAATKKKKRRREGKAATAVQANGVGGHQGAGSGAGAGAGAGTSVGGRPSTKPSKAEKKAAKAAAKAQAALSSKLERAVASRVRAAMCSLQEQQDLVRDDWVCASAVKAFSRMHASWRAGGSKTRSGGPAFQVGDSNSDEHRTVVRREPSRSVTSPGW